MPEFRRCCFPLDVRLVGLSPHSLEVLESSAGLGEGVEPLLVGAVTSTGGLLYLLWSLSEARDCGGSVPCRPLSVAPTLPPAKGFNLD